jgi:hypothetical protein
MRLLQMTERQRLPKLVENNKIIRLTKEMNGIIEELLKENETDILDLNHLIYAAATVIMEKVTKPGKTVKSRRNENSWKVRIQSQISNWRKELSILAESGPGPDNFKLNIKKEENFSEIQSNRSQRSSTTDRKHRRRPNESEDMKEEKTSTSKINCSRKTQSNSTNIWEQKLLRSKTSHIWRKLSLTGSHYGKKK